MITLNELDLVHKPNQTIMITNGQISAIGRKAYNIILADAKKQLSENKNIILFQYSIHDIKARAGIKATNNKEIKDAVFGLRDIKVEIIKDNGDWLTFSLLAQAEKKDDLLEIQLPEKIRQAIQDANFYTTLDLLTMKSLRKKYAIILYEVCKRYERKDLNAFFIPKFTIEEFRNLVGISSEEYKIITGLVNRVIEPALQEINDKTDITINYEFDKIGRTHSHIKFHAFRKQEVEKIEITQKQNPKEQIEQTEQRQKEINELIAMLPVIALTGLENNELSNLLQKHSKEAIAIEIEYTVEVMKTKEVKKFWAYLQKCLEDGFGQKARKAANEKIENENKIKKDKEEKKQNEERIRRETIEKKVEERYKNLTEIEKEKIAAAQTRIPSMKTKPFQLFARFYIQDELERDTF